MLGLSLFGIAMPFQVAAVPSKGQRNNNKDISRCARFSQVADKERRRVTFALDNRCGVPLSCHVGWQVACGLTGEPEVKQLQTRLDTSASESFSASASHCEGDWAINEVTWGCDPAP